MGFAVPIFAKIINGQQQ